MYLKEPSKIKRLCKKAISILLIGTFLFSSISFAVPDDQAHLMADAVSAGKHPSVSLPKTLASVRSANISSDGKLIINIQDAHASLGAQESIVKMLETLVADYDIKLIALEGSDGYVNTSLLRSFPDERIKKKTGELLMKEGKMSAGEFFSIVSSRPVALYGVEDAPLYNTNLELFRRVFDMREALDADLSAIERRIRTLQEKVYSADMEEFVSKQKSFASEAPDLKEHLKYLDKVASKHEIKCDAYPNIRLLQNAIMQEDGIDFNLANNERDVLIGIISKKLDKAGLETLLKKTVAFKNGEISQGEFYPYLFAESARLNIDIIKYPLLAKFAAYLSTYDSIDLIGLFSEIGHYEDAIAKGILTTDNEQALYRASRFAGLLRNLFDAKLTNASLADFLNEKAFFDKDRFFASLRKNRDKYAPKDNVERSVEKIFAYIPEAVEFYRVAEERNASILRNTIKKMSDTKEEMAVLITGGFHSEGISKILKGKRSSYVVLLPKFDSSKGERPYVAILTNKTPDYTPLLDSGTYHLAVRAYFDGVGRGELEENLDRLMYAFSQAISMKLDELKSAQGATKDISAEIDSVIELWLRNYEAEYNALGDRLPVTEIEKLLSPKEFEVYVHRLTKNLITAYTAQSSVFAPLEAPGAEKRFSTTGRDIYTLTDEELLGLVRPGNAELRKHMLADLDYATAIARRLGYGDNSQFMDKLRILCLSHDIGGVLGDIELEAVETALLKRAKESGVQYIGVDPDVVAAQLGEMTDMERRNIGLMDHANNTIRIFEANEIDVPQDIEQVIRMHMKARITEEDVASLPQETRDLIACFIIADVFEFGNNYYKRAASARAKGLDTPQYETTNDTLDFIKKVKLSGCPSFNNVIQAVEDLVMDSGFDPAIAASRSPIEDYVSFNPLARFSATGADGVLRDYLEKQRRIKEIFIRMGIINPNDTVTFSQGEIAYYLSLYDESIRGAKFEHVPTFVAEDEDAMSLLAADMVVNTVKANPSAVIGLTAGDTPVKMYAELARRANLGLVDFSNVTFVQPDSYILDPRHPQSYRNYLHEVFFSKLNRPVSASQIHLLEYPQLKNADGEVDVSSGEPTTSAEDTAIIYEAFLEAHPMDLLILGIGGWYKDPVTGVLKGGHIGFNEPGSSEDSKTRVTDLSRKTRHDAVGRFGGLENVPRQAVTMGVSTILKAKKILMVASGEHKAESIRAAVEGDRTVDVPASLLQGHPGVTYVVDNRAASLLMRNLSVNEMNRFDKEHGSLTLSKGARIVNIEEGILRDPVSMMALRREIEDSYRLNASMLAYDSANVQEMDLELPESGLMVKVGYPANRPPFIAGENLVSHVLHFRGVNYYFGARGRPYTPGHFVFGAENLKQAGFGYDQLLLSAIMAQVMGVEYELFYNGVTPTTEELHIQCIQKKDTIWDYDITKWPCLALKYEVDTIGQLRRIFSDYEEYGKRGAKVDIILHYNAWKQKIEIIMIPRDPSYELPPSKPEYGLGDLGNGDHYGTYGALEMGGYLIGVKEGEVFEWIRTHQRLFAKLYEDSLKELSWEGGGPHLKRTVPDLTRGSATGSTMSYDETMNDAGRLAGVEAVMTDLDGVDRSHGDELIPETIIDAKSALSSRGVFCITITGNEVDEAAIKFGGLLRLGYAGASRGYYLLARSGGNGVMVGPDGNIQPIRSDRGEFESPTLGSLEAVAAISAAARDVMLEVAGRHGIVTDAVDRVRIVAGEAGTVLFVEDDPRIQEVRFEIANAMRERIAQLREDGVVSNPVYVAASVGGVDITPTTKGASAIQMIKLFHLTRVVLIADAVGTEENPGNDRSLLSLTQEELAAAGIDWEVDLIKIYVGRETDAEIPDGVIIAPQGEKETDPAFNVYTAINSAKDRFSPSGNIIIGIPAADHTKAEIEAASGLVNRLTDGKAIVKILTADTPQARVEELARISGEAGIRFARVLDVESLDAGAIAMTLSDIIGEAQLDEDQMRQIEAFLVKDLPGLTRVDIDAIIKTYRDRSRQYDPSSSYEYTPSTSAYFETSVQSYNGPRRPQAASVTTTGVLEGGLSWASRIEARWQKMGVTNKQDDPIKEYIVVTGQTEPWDSTKIDAYLYAQGLQDYIDAENVIFTNSTAELADIISARTGLSYDKIGIRSCEGELRTERDDIITIELKRDESGAYYNINMYEMLFDLLSLDANAELQIPGLSKIGNRVYMYLPKSIPVNYKEEVERYKRVVQHILTAA